jgi:hypothetical protein
LDHFGYAICRFHDACCLSYTQGGINYTTIWSESSSAPSCDIDDHDQDEIIQMVIEAVLGEDEVGIYRLGPRLTRDVEDWFLSVL